MRGSHHDSGSLRNAPKVYIVLSRQFVVHSRKTSWFTHNVSRKPYLIDSASWSSSLLAYNDCKDGSVEIGITQTMREKVCVLCMYASTFLAASVR
jgi:hypothetical protein